MNHSFDPSCTEYQTEIRGGPQQIADQVTCEEALVYHGKAATVVKERHDNLMSHGGSPQHLLDAYGSVLFETKQNEETVRDFGMNSFQSFHLGSTGFCLGKEMIENPFEPTPLPPATFDNRERNVGRLGAENIYDILRTDVQKSSPRLGDASSKSDGLFSYFGCLLPHSQVVDLLQNKRSASCLGNSSESAMIDVASQHALATASTGLQSGSHLAVTHGMPFCFEAVDCSRLLVLPSEFAPQSESEQRDRKRPRNESIDKEREQLRQATSAAFIPTTFLSESCQNNTDFVDLFALPSQIENPLLSNGNKRESRLFDLMRQSEKTQKELQEWDKLQGLPKSHCTTMVKTSRSRRQLIEGRILPKWDGTPMITENAAPVKPRRKNKARAKSDSLNT